jgi:hypothetical protein
MRLVYGGYDDFWLTLFSFLVCVLVFRLPVSTGFKVVAVVMVTLWGCWLTYASESLLAWGNLFGWLLIYNSVPDLTDESENDD